MFITFEGLDFSGKSTQVELLAERLRSENREVRVLREPGATRVGEAIRSILLDKNHTSISPLSEFLLFSASRAQLVEEVIRPALAEGVMVICDRFFDSSTAYQGWGRGLRVEDVQHINRIATGGLEPAATFFVDIPVEEVERRMKAGGGEKDRMETAGTAFYERVRRGYLTLAEKEKRIHVVNGLLAREVLHHQIWETVERELRVRMKA